MKKALVIGSEGNIGRPLCAYLQTRGYEVMTSDHKPAWRNRYIMADIRNPIDLFPAFDWRPDIVFMLAAMVSRVTCEQAGSLAVETNLLGLQNILELCKRVSARLIYFSTSEVYGPEVTEMDEELVPKPNNRYGLSKLLGEHLVEYEVEHYGFQAVTLRPFMMYDEEEDFGDHRSAMIRFAYNLALGLPIEIHQNSERGWMHVSDAVRGIEAAARVPEYTVINIGSPDIRPIAELAEMLRGELGAARELIQVRNLPERMTLRKAPKLARQRDLLGIELLVNLEQGTKIVARRVRQRLAHMGLLPQG
jgi:nucleoside-diphosphate-sugar epimerase